MANTFELIASSTVGAGGAANIEFTSIANTWTDLVLKTVLRGTRAANYESVKIEFNGSTSNLSCRQLFGDGATAASSSSGTQILFDTSGASNTANTFGTQDIYIPNYAVSTNKSVSIDSVSENNATTAYALIVAGLWANTAAITSIKLTPTSGTFVQYSTAYLYGVKNA